MFSFQRRLCRNYWLRFRSEPYLVLLLVLLSQVLSELCHLLILGLFESEHQALHLIAHFFLLCLQILQLLLFRQVLSLFVLVESLLLFVGILSLLQAGFNPLNILLQSMNLHGCLLRLH